MTGAAEVADKSVGEPSKEPRTTLACSSDRFIDECQAELPSAPLRSRSPPAARAKSRPGHNQPGGSGPMARDRQVETAGRPD